MWYFRCTLAVLIQQSNYHQTENITWKDNPSHVWQCMLWPHVQQIFLMSRFCLGFYLHQYFLICYKQTSCRSIFYEGTSSFEHPWPWPCQSLSDDLACKAKSQEKKINYWDQQTHFKWTSPILIRRWSIRASSMWRMKICRLIARAEVLDSTFRVVILACKKPLN